MLEKFSIKNTNAIITGAAGLLGIQHIHTVLLNGGNVILIDINKSKLNKRLKDLFKKFERKRIRSFCGDITNEKFVKTVCQKIIKQKQNIDILINNDDVYNKIDIRHKK